jgi:colanic acid/amylovoran biosynthesis glycosyltransferase
MFHGFDIRLGIDKDGIIYKDLIKHIDKVQAISKYNKKHLLEFGFPESKIVFHPVGIDLSKFTQKTNYIPGKTIQILSIGRLVLEKGYKYGIEAIAKLIHEQKVDLCYTIIGEGDLFHDLKNLCNKLNIEKIVRFEGAKGRNDIIRYLHNSDIFFLPSVAEALPVALMEALSCGLPTVATNVGSVKELVIDNENGFVSEPKSIDSIANRLVQLIEAKENWMEMGQSGHKHINANYNIKILNTKLIKK